MTANSLPALLLTVCGLLTAGAAEARCIPNNLPYEIREHAYSYSTLQACEEAQPAGGRCVCDEPTKEQLEREFRKMGAMVDMSLERIDGEEGAPVLRITNGSTHRIERMVYEVAYYAGGQRICEHWNMWHDADLDPAETVLLREDVRSDDQTHGTDCRYRFQSLGGSDDVVFRLLSVKVEKAVINGHTSDDGRWEIQRSR